MDLKRVLFVCLGNACRSQMAEGFARAQGDDVLISWSAGLTPAHAIPALTFQAMAEKKIDITGQTPKPVDDFSPSDFDLVINISGYPIPGYRRTIDWTVRDPYGGSVQDYRATRDEIERRVRELIFELRRAQKLRL
jgi:protein-tyrosine-phosphatase